jgi:4-hydroxybenzoate polyprenyltransferase
LAIILLGYYFSEGRLNQFPKEIILFFIIGVTFLLNFLDLKKYEFDTEQKVLTIPTLIGLNHAKLLSGIFFIFIPPLFGIILSNLIITVSLFVIGIVDFVIINKIEKSEKFILITNTLKMIIILFFLVTIPQLIPYTV